jgi:hypothetical protein
VYDVLEHRISLAWKANKRVFAMPRQPFKPYADRHRGGRIDIGTRAISQRPELFALVGKCLIAWPHIEAEMALLLGQLLGADNAAALAVFQTLRRSTAQRDAISEAGKASLDKTDFELLTAILSVHKAIESERNALAHGHMGIYSDMDDAVLWLSTADYIAFKSLLVLVGDRNYDETKREKLNSCLYYYKAPDLEAILNDIDLMGWIWSEMRDYLQATRPQQRAELYHRLCDRPRVAQELGRLRGEKNLPSSP